MPKTVLRACEAYSGRELEVKNTTDGCMANFVCPTAITKRLTFGKVTV